MRKIFTLIFIFNAGFLIAQNNNTSLIDCDTLNQDIMVNIKSQQSSEVGVYITEGGSHELVSVKDDDRYVKYIPRPWRYNLKLSLQINFTDEDIKNLISNIQVVASKEIKLPENWWGRLGYSSPLIYPWYEVYDFMTKYKDWVIGESRIRCTHCLKRTMLIYYITPDYAWRGLYGRAGYFLICPHCLKQLDFYCMVMN